MPDINWDMETAYAMADGWMTDEEREELEAFEMGLDME